MVYISDNSIANTSKLLCFLRASSNRDGRNFLGRDLRKKNIIINVGGNTMKLQISPTAI